MSQPQFNASHALLSNHLAALLIVTLFIPLTIGTAQEQVELINHNPATTTTSDMPLAIDVTVENSLQVPVEGRIYYRGAGEDAYSYAEMSVDRFTLSGTIPAAVIVDEYIEYYLEVLLPDNRKLTYPEGVLDSGNPIRTEIRPVGAGEGRGEGAIAILSPEPGSILSEDRVLIALTLMQQVKSIDYKKLRVSVDGLDRTRSAQISEDMIILVIEGMKPGEHHAALYLFDQGKKEKLVGWGFLLRSPEEIERPPGVFRGDLNVTYIHEDISEESRDIGYLDGRINGKFRKLDYAAKAYVTSLEKTDLQPQNRYLGSLRYGVLTLRGGDVQPQLSEFSLWGTRTRGAQLALRTAYYNMDVVWGYLRRDIEGAGRMDTVVVINPITGAVEIDPTTGDTVKTVERITERSATYGRKLLAIRPAFRFGRNATWGLNLLKVKDDVNSVKWGEEPVDNVVLGTDLRLNFDHNRIVLNTETAISLYNSDISEGAMGDAEMMEDIIVINRYFDPLPTDSTILEEGIGFIDLSTKLLGELLVSSTAHRTSLMLNYFKNELRLRYKNVGHSFRSLGSPTVMNDVKGFSVQDRVRLLSNRLYLTIGYESYRNNVNDRGKTTTIRNIFSGSIAYYSPPKYPNISFGFRQHNRDNNETPYTVTLPNDSVETVDYRLKNSTSSLNMGINQSFSFAGFQHSARFMFSSSKTEDKTNVSGSGDNYMNSLSLSLNSRRWLRLDYSAALRVSKQESRGGSFLVDYNMVSLGSRYMLLADQLWISGGLNLTLADGVNKALHPLPEDADSSRTDLIHSAKIKYNRIQLSLGAEYQPAAQHEFRLSGYKVFHPNGGYIDYWNWDGGTSSWDTLRVKNNDSADLIKQNDFVTRLSYTYSF